MFNILGLEKSLSRHFDIVQTLIAPLLLFLINASILRKDIYIIITNNNSQSIKSADAFEIISKIPATWFSIYSKFRKRILEISAAINSDEQSMVFQTQAKAAVLRNKIFPNQNT